MREQLIQYVNLLFAGAPDSEEIKMEILQNTLDRYDDLVSQGKSPEAAYRLAISGIGDINEILGTIPQPGTTFHTQTIKEAIHEEAEEIKNKKLRAVAIAMYILCIVPLIVLGDLDLDNLGLCLTLALVAVATYLMIITSKKDEDDEEKRADSVYSPRNELKKSIATLIWTIGLIVYLILSFVTGAWHTTWVLFPIIGCVQGLANAIIDLKEANKYEN